MTTLEFHDPSGAIEVTQAHAPRIPSLAQSFCSRFYS